MPASLTSAIFAPCSREMSSSGARVEFVVLVVADERFANFVVVEKLLGVARVFAGDLVDFLEDAQGPQGDVFEIADGRANEVQAAQGAFVVGRSCCVRSCI